MVMQPINMTKSAIHIGFEPMTFTLTAYCSTS